VSLAMSARPRLAAMARLRWDAHERRTVLLSPERGLVLNPTAARVLELCDGAHTVDEIVDALVQAYAPAERARIARDVLELLGELRDRSLLETSA
jgi:pyrroloquinoline quinone biosynthesis protein D